MSSHLNIPGPLDIYPMIFHSAIKRSSIHMRKEILIHIVNQSFPYAPINFSKSIVRETNSSPIFRTKKLSENSKHFLFEPKKMTENSCHIFDQLFPKRFA